MMTHWIRSIVLAWGLMGLLGGVAAVAEDVEFATTSELATYNRRLNSLERRLATIEQEPDLVAPEEFLGEECCSSACDGAGFLFMAELLFLRPFNTDADFDSDSDTQRFKESVRLTAGWTTASGIGLRGRWFEYDVNTPDSNFQLQVVDAEFASRISLGTDWYAIVSGGARYAEYVESNEANRLEGALGPLMGLEFGRYLTDNVSLYARGRQAVVFGRDLVDNDMAVFATEIQLGADMHYSVNDCLAVFGRVAWEGQFWTGMASEDSETFGLSGLVLALGMTR